METAKINEFYTISSDGMIFSNRYNKVMKVDNSQRYSRIQLFINGEKQRWLVHRLVAKYFLPKPENKPYINHKNGDIYDNRVENLEWCTQQENVIHAFETGLKKYGHSELQAESWKKAQANSAKAKIILSDKDVISIRQMIDDKVMIKDIAIKYKVSIDTIARVKYKRGAYK